MNKVMRAWLVVLLAAVFAAGPAHAGLIKKGLAVAIGAAIAKGSPWAIKALKAAAKDPKKREAVIAHAKEYAEKHPKLAAKVKDFIVRFEKGKLDDLVQKYVAAPRSPPTWIKGGREVRAKTPVQGGGPLRKRWLDDEGNIYEWDTRHGTVEKYTRTRKHLGEFDADTGELLSDAIPGRIVQK
ncbi:MAG: hypothetical protein CVV05_00090 [Gammaproteobacteria bacterium HGW-Gammaproteobacteria-1]|jgi:hypothetical protein|nr:MAG: hypothetical protein CVV05_00090 [Gammaproteobacteria bacterium HGW-Gammaproteobacteria-1]